MITKLLSNQGYIMCNKNIARLIGLHEAIILGELSAEYEYWVENNRLIDDEWFFSTAENIKFNTTLSEKQQRTAIKNLEELNILSTKLIGLPAKKHFKINDEEIIKLLNNGETSSAKTAELDVTNVPINNNIINNNKNKTFTKVNVEDKKQSSFNFGSSKPKKLSLYDKCLLLINDYTKNENLKDTLINYLKFRLERSKEENKPFFSNNFKGILNDLDKKGKTDDEKISILDYSLSAGYITLYPMYSKTSNKKFNENIETNIKKPKSKREMTNEEYLSTIARDENGNILEY